MNINIDIVVFDMIKDWRYQRNHLVYICVDKKTTKSLKKLDYKTNTIDKKKKKTQHKAWQIQQHEPHRINHILSLWNNNY